MDDHTPLLSSMAAGATGTSEARSGPKRYDAGVVREGAVESATFKGIVPDEDVDESRKAKLPVVSRPPASFFDDLPHYESLSTSERPAPLLDECPRVMPEASSGRQVPPPQKLTQHAARNALLDEVGRHRCWGKGPANQIVLTSIVASSAFHYKLESFTEHRYVSWAYEPYHGGSVDGPKQGVPPEPWCVPAEPPVLFRTSEQILEVPHTSNIKACHHCAGQQKVRCHLCCGRGKLRCRECRGAGHTMRKDKDGNRLRETCRRCYGTGRRRCPECVGHGQYACSECAGSGKLRTFVRLFVRWRNNSDDHVAESRTGPGGAVARAEGTLLFEEEHVLVPPIATFPDDRVTTGSFGLISRHLQQWREGRILRQRQSIRSIPVHDCQGIYRDQHMRYWVYGLDQQVYAPDYPAKVACGCVLQ